MADLSVKNIGIGLASSLLAGAISVAAATSVGASARPADSSAPAYVYTESDQASGNTVLAFRASGGVLTSFGSFATGGDGTGAALGSQGALTLADGGRALLAVNAGSNTVSYFRILSNGNLRLVDAVPSGGAHPVSVTAHGRWVQVLNAGSNTVGGLELTGSALIPSPHPAVALSAGAATPEQIGFTPSGSQVIVTEKVSSTIDVFNVTSSGSLTGLHTTASSGTAPYGFGFSANGDAIVSDAGGGAGGVSAATSYRVGDAGALHPVSEIGESQAAACWLIVNAPGNRAYLANAGSGTVSSYNIAASGDLTLRSAVAATVGGHPIDEALGAGSLFVLTSGAIASAPVTASGDLGAANETAVTGLPAATSGLVLAVITG